MSGIDKYELLSDLAKRRGFFWPSFEIYGGVSGYLDLGPLGAKLKRSIEEKWLKLFVYQHGFAVISTPIITPEKVFIASGHVEHFKDLMVSCLECKRHFKADYVITEAMPGRTDLALEAMPPSEIDSFIATNHIRCPECGGPLSKAEYSLTMFKTNIGPYGDAVGYGRPEAAQGIFIDFKRVFESSREKLPLGIAQVGTAMRNEISPRQGPIRLREFTIMEMELFFDPEAPKCAFLERVKDVELPILLAKEREQRGSKSTNLSVHEALKQGVVLTEWGAYFMALSVKFVQSLGIPLEKQRFEEKMQAERSHYSSQTFDHQIWLDRWGWVEIAGHAYRTDFDLSAHIKSSGADLSIFKPYDVPTEKRVTVIVPIDSSLGPMLREKAKPVIEALKQSNPDQVKRAIAQNGYYEVQGFKIQPTQLRFEDRVVRETGRRVVPHVVEPSYGAERVTYSLLEYSYTRNKDRIVLKLPPELAPTKVMIFPLMPKDGLSEIGSTIQQVLLESGIETEYDEAGTIGRRYARADEVGVPLSITVDYQTKNDQTVTVRDRDSWQQVRRQWKELPQHIHRFLRSEIKFQELGDIAQVNYE
ncbi:MAG TPA: glycine--tRNA ligase [Candidatus Acidoferrales bacterium]|nr:glycine--tRNA ligase [Candidatus Acidoferrales bacterium]